MKRGSGEMKLRLNGKELDWEPKKLVIAGYTGRDQASVKQHIQELEEVGIAPPPRVPMLYDLSPQLLVAENEISVVRNASSGEAEYVLFDIEGQWYVGLGSDHTDRALEAISVHQSKQVCLKPVASEIWPLADIRSHWDEIEMNSWVVKDGREELYQSGKLDAFLYPEAIIELVRERGFYEPGTAIFCGTLVLLNGTFVYGESFRAEMKDPVRNRTISYQYKIKTLQDSGEVIANG